MRKKSSIAFVSPENVCERKTWSGIPYYMIKAIQESWGDVGVFYWEKNKLQDLIILLIKIASKIFFRKNFDPMKSIFYSKMIGQQLSKKLGRKKYDIIVCNGGFPIAYLETDTPIIICTDSAFGLLVNYYPNRNYSKKLIQSGRIIEQRGYNKASLIVLASSWAADYARKNYSCGNKIEVIPFGANIESAPDMSVIDYRLQNKDVCNLLFLGVDWKRKGGDIVIKTLNILKKRGMNVHLTICGCNPKISNDDITIVPFVDKNSKEGLEQFKELLTKSHFMFVPSRAECYGVVFAEASAYGMPVISTNTGGVSAVVENTRNGYLLPLSATDYNYANIIQSIYLNESKYRDLCLSARKKYEETLNWKSFIKSLMELFDKK